MRMQAYRRSSAFEVTTTGTIAVERTDGGRYGADVGGVRWPTLAAIVALHLIGLWALVTLDVIHVVHAKLAPTVVTLLPEVPPPPANPEPAPPTPAPVQVVAPPPIVAVIQQAPVQIRAVEVAPPPAPVRTAAPVAAASGPPSDTVTPPDFAGDQLGNAAPKYPMMSRRLREQGTTVVRVTVTPAGRAAGCRVQRSSGVDRLDQAALGAVCGWKFQPATRGGVAVEWPMDVPIPFVLRG